MNQPNNQQPNNQQKNCPGHENLIAVALAVSNAYSTSIDICWEEDSPTSFALNISGTGFGWKDTILSPSGLWELTMGFGINPWGEPGMLSGNLVLFSQSGYITYLGSPVPLPLYTHGFVFPEPADLGPVFGMPFDVRGWEFVKPNWKSEPNWLNLTCIPDFMDPSTWTWETRFAARAVPEGGGLLCLVFAAGLILFFRPRKENAWTS